MAEQTRYVTPPRWHLCLTSQSVKRTEPPWQLGQGHRGSGRPAQPPSCRQLLHGLDPQASDHRTNDNFLYWAPTMLRALYGQSHSTLTDSLGVQDYYCPILQMRTQKPKEGKQLNHSHTIRKWWRQASHTDLRLSGLSFAFHPPVALCYSLPEVRVPGTLDVYSPSLASTWVHSTMLLWGLLWHQSRQASPSVLSSQQTMLWILLMFYFLLCKLHSGPGGGCLAHKLGVR